MPYYPALIIGIVLTIYWGRVLRLAYKIRRTTGRSANFAPVEPLGRMLRALWYPAVLVWTVQPYLAAFVEHPRGVLRPLFMVSALSWAMAGVAVLALAGTMVCWKRMGKSWRMGINPDEKTQLIVSGPYAYVRHPIYALSSVIMLATLAVIPSPLMLAAGAVHLGLLQWEARREEKYLAVHHGEAYVEYCGKVGRFVPKSLRAYDGRKLFA